MGKRKKKKNVKKDKKKINPMRNTKFLTPSLTRKIVYFVIATLVIPLIIARFFEWRSNISVQKQTDTLTKYINTSEKRIVSEVDRFNALIEQSQLPEKQKTLVRKLLDETLKLDKKADFVRVKSNLEFLLQTVPENEVVLRAIFFNCLGNLYFTNQLYDKAVEAFTKSIELNPEEAVTYYNLGNVFFGQRKFEESIQWYKKSVEKDPKFFAPYYNTGNAFAALKKFDDSINAFRKAEEFSEDEYSKKQAKNKIEDLEMIKNFDSETRDKFNFYFYGSEGEQYSELEKLAQEMNISLVKSPGTKEHKKVMEQYLGVVHLLEYGRFEDALEGFNKIISDALGFEYELRSKVHWLLIKLSIIKAKERIGDLMGKKIIVDNLHGDEREKYASLGRKYGDSAFDDLNMLLERSSHWEEEILEKCPYLDFFSPIYIDNLTNNLVCKSDSELIALLKEKEPDEIFKEILPTYVLSTYVGVYEMTIDGKLKFGGEFHSAEFMYWLGITTDGLSKAFYLIDSRNPQVERGLRYAMHCYRKVLTLKPDEQTLLLTNRNIEALQSFAPNLFEVGHH